MRNPPAIILCAHLPPPVDGMAFASRKIADAFTRADVSFRLFDISGSQHDGLGYHLRRIWRTLRAMAYTLLAPRNPHFVYMPVNAGVGQIYNLCISACARAKGKRVIFHHHSFSYVDSYNRGIALLLRVAGTNAIHLVLCDCMGQRLSNLYGQLAAVINLPSAFYSEISETKPSAPGETILLGHLSNLTLEKGLGECIALHRALLERGFPVKLILAGPSVTQDASELLDRARREFPDTLEYLGKLDEVGKDAFYKRIDAFLFPTLYRIEADPIVVSDAQAHGCAAIVFARGCLSERVDNEVGMAIAPGEDYVSTVLAAIPGAEELRTFAAVRGHAARKRHMQLQAEAREEFSRLVAVVLNKPN
jgi:glycosyltransferase involved in cell wall biosynthesis